MPKNAHTDPDSGLRWYEWTEGGSTTACLSVTSLRRILGMSFGLHNWVVKQTIEAAIDIVPQHSGIDFKAEEVTPPADRDAVAKAIRKASTVKRDEAADLGSRVHDAADQHLDPKDADADVAPFLEQFYAAKAALDLKPVRQEAQVWNLDLGYAGTLDCLGYVTPKPDEGEWLALVDYKTGSGLYVDHLLQLLAYAHADFVGTDGVRDDEGTRYLKSTQGLAILHLAADGWEWVELKVTPEAVNAFADMTRLAVWWANNPNLDPHIAHRVGAGKYA